MEVQSMHSAIVNATKYIPVYITQDWINIFDMDQSNRL